MSKAIAWRATAVAMLLLTSGLATPARPTTVIPCHRTDRNATFVVPKGRLGDFRAAVRAFAPTHGLRYREETYKPVRMQYLSGPGFTWGMVVSSADRESTADAAFDGSADCDHDLSVADAKVWGDFVRALQARGFVSTVYRPRFRY